MHNVVSKLELDLELFIKKFEPSKFKVMPKGIEIRGVNNLHRSMLYAQEIIVAHQLSLEISHNAEMISYRCFEVNFSG